MEYAVLNSKCFRTSLKERVAYGLPPSDMIMEPLSTRRAVFLRCQLDWDRLCDALGKVEAAYPPLCGRCVSNEKGEGMISVDPNDENGFGAVEVGAETTLAGIRSSKAMVATFEATGARISWPFFLERGIADPILNGAGSLFGVHLTHAKDGCVLSFAFRHLLCDGLRMAELMVDVSRAYRGLEISQRHLDRSILWPDRYLSRFTVPGRSPESYPPYGRVQQSPYNSTTSELRLAQIHLPKATIDKMKALTGRRLCGVDFVSTNDLLVAFGWMLSAEFSSESHSLTAASLDMKGTCAQLALEVGTSCLPVIPVNYFGNALATLEAKWPIEEPVGDTLLDTLAHAASRVHQAVHEGRTKPEAVILGLLTAYSSSSTAQEDSTSREILWMSTQAKLPFDKIDFGDERQQYIFMPPSLPCTERQSGVEVNPNGDGVLVYMALEQADRRRLKASRVLAECAPGAELLPEPMSEADAGRLMRL